MIRLRKRGFDMSKKMTEYLGIGLGIGVVVGVAASIWYRKKATVDANLVLEKVKKSFLEEGPIEGAWIQYHQEPLQKFALKTKVYLGGITRLEDDEMIQYEFVADAYTGSVLDIYRLEN